MSLKRDEGKMKTRLTSLWIFVMLNWLYCDIMSLMDPATTASSLKIAITPAFLLGASILMEIPMIMILVSKFTPWKVNRMANIIAASIMTLVQIASLFAGDVTIYYIFFSIIEIACTVFIAWSAVRWRQDKRRDLNPAEICL